MTTTVETTTRKISIGKNIFIAYILWFFLGYFGVHRFYAGKYLSGGIQLGLSALIFLLAITVIGLVIAWPLGIILGIWWFIDAFLMLGWGVGTDTEIVTTTTNTKD